MSNINLIITRRLPLWISLELLRQLSYLCKQCEQNVNKYAPSLQKMFSIVLSFVYAVAESTPLFTVSACIFLHNTHFVYQTNAVFVSCSYWHKKHDNNLTQFTFQHTPNHPPQYINVFNVQHINASIYVGGRCANAIRTYTYIAEQNSFMIWCIVAVVVWYRLGIQCH